MHTAHGSDLTVGAMQVRSREASHIRGKRKIKNAGYRGVGIWGVWGLWGCEGRTELRDLLMMLHDDTYARFMSMMFSLDL